MVIVYYINNILSLDCRLQGRSSERLLDSIQGELKHLEEYILRLQKQLKGIVSETGFVQIRLGFHYTR
jgi:hypothetical protein